MGALIREHGAARIDIVHRHNMPRFEQVELEVRRPPRRADTPAARVLARPSPTRTRSNLRRRFWEVGGLTLEHWLVAPLDCEEITRWPGTEVAGPGRSRPATVSCGYCCPTQPRLDRRPRCARHRLPSRPHQGSLPRGRAQGRRKRAVAAPCWTTLWARLLAGLYVTGFSANAENSGRSSVSSKDRPLPPP